MAQHKGSLGGGVFSIREVEYLESLPAVDRRAQRSHRLQ